jgi:hypothetical protein
MQNGTTKSKRILKSYYHHDDDEELKEEEINEFCRYKDKSVAMFILARGYRLRGWEYVEETDVSGKKRSMTQFCFDGNKVTRAAFVEYHALDTPEEHNVNAKRYNDAMRTINSIIQNRP